jgi:hypothetical protein
MPSAVETILLLVGDGVIVIVGSMVEVDVGISIVAVSTGAMEVSVEKIVGLIKLVVVGVMPSGFF